MKVQKFGSTKTNKEKRMWQRRVGGLKDLPEKVDLFSSYRKKVSLFLNITFRSIILLRSAYFRVKIII